MSWRTRGIGDRSEKSQGLNEESRKVYGNIRVWENDTVKSFMFARLLFREFRKLNKTVKLKGVNIDTVPTLTGVTRVGIVRLEFAKIKGAKIIMHAKSPTFRLAKLKGFTVLVELGIWTRLFFCWHFVWHDPLCAIHWWLMSWILYWRSGGSACWVMTQYSINNLRHLLTEKLTNLFTDWEVAICRRKHVWRNW